MSELQVDITGLKDIEAIEQVPLEARLEYDSTYQVIEAAAKAHPDRVAINYLANGTADEEPVIVTYAQLLARVNQTANMFNDFGLEKTQAVSYLLPNLPQTHFVIWGGEAAGIVNAINPLLTPGQIAGIMKAAGSKMLVALGPAPGTDIWEKAMAVRELYPDLEVIFQVGGPGEPEAGIHPFDETVAKYPADKLVSGRVIGADEICSYFHTGGTTGSPKLARHTHRGEVYDAWVISRLANFDEGDVLLLGLPLFHVNAVIVTGLAPFMMGASTVLLTAAGYRHPNVLPNFWKVVERYRGSFFSAVPTIYSALLGVPLDGADVSSLKYAICGAAPMPVEVFRAFEERTGIKILEGYGLTEGTCASSINPPAGERRVGSIGIRFPYQDMKAVVIDEDGNYVRDAKDGEIGNICISGPNVTPGYLQAEFNKGLFPAPGLLNTGDLGRRDGDGYFWLTGRAKDLIIRGGHNIDPGLIEECLHQHPAVALAAAVGRPDAYAGEIPVAYVVLKEGATATAEELKQYARDHIAERPAAPAEIFLIDDMPVTAVGKIFKPTLRHDIIRRAYEAALMDVDTCGAKLAVTVAPHGSHGTLASVHVSGGAEGSCQAVQVNIDKALGGFAVNYEVVWE